jgi:hypothetical protein
VSNFHCLLFSTVLLTCAHFARVSSAIGAMSSGGNEPADCDMVDDVFEEAVRRGIVLRSDSMDTCSEFDLSGMSLPVARAAVRFVLKRLASPPAMPNSLSFITGGGRAGVLEAVLRHCENTCKRFCCKTFTQAYFRLCLNLHKERW